VPPLVQRPKIWPLYLLRSTRR